MPRQAIRFDPGAQITPAAGPVSLAVPAQQRGGLGYALDLRPLLRMKDMLFEQTPEEKAKAEKEAKERALAFFVSKQEELVGSREKFEEATKGASLPDSADRFWQEQVASLSGASAAMTRYRNRLMSFREQAAAVVGKDGQEQAPFDSAPVKAKLWEDLVRESYALQLAPGAAAAARVKIAADLEFDQAVAEARDKNRRDFADDLKVQQVFDQVRSLEAQPLATPEQTAIFQGNLHAIDSAMAAAGTSNATQLTLTGIERALSQVTDPRQGLRIIQAIGETKMGSTTIGAHPDGSKLLAQERTRFRRLSEELQLDEGQGFERRLAREQQKLLSRWAETFVVYAENPMNLAPLRQQIGLDIDNSEEIPVELKGPLKLWALSQTEALSKSRDVRSHETRERLVAELAGGADPLLVEKKADAAAEEGLLSGSDVLAVSKAVMELGDAAAVVGDDRALRAASDAIGDDVARMFFPSDGEDDKDARALMASGVLGAFQQEFNSGWRTEATGAGTLAERSVATRRWIASHLPNIRERARVAAKEWAAEHATVTGAINGLTARGLDASELLDSPGARRFFSLDRIETLRKANAAKVDPEQYIPKDDRYIAEALALKGAGGDATAIARDIFNNAIGVSLFEVDDVRAKAKALFRTKLAAIRENRAIPASSIDTMAADAWRDAVKESVFAGPAGTAAAEKAKGMLPAGMTVEKREKQLAEAAKPPAQRRAEAVLPLMAMPDRERASAIVNRVRAAAKENPDLPANHFEAYARLVEGRIKSWQAREAATAAAQEVLGNVDLLAGGKDDRNERVQLMYAVFGLRPEHVLSGTIVVEPQPAIVQRMREAIEEERATQQKIVRWVPTFGPDIAPAAKIRYLTERLIRYEVPFDAAALDNPLLVDLGWNDAEELDAWHNNTAKWAELVAKLGLDPSEAGILYATQAALLQIARPEKDMIEWRRVRDIFGHLVEEPFRLPD